MNLRYLILGLLVQRPMSGYDIKTSLESLSWLVGSPSYGNLYPTLHTLHEEGLVTVDVILNHTKPPRKIYHLTDAGKQSLRAWLQEPVQDNLSLKPFTMRLILAGELSPAALYDYLAQRRSQVATYLSSVTEDNSVAEAEAGSVTGADAEPDGIVPGGLAHDFGMAVARAELAWLDHKMAQIAQESARSGAHQSVQQNGAVGG